MALRKTAVLPVSHQQSDGLSGGQPARSVGTPNDSAERMQLDPEQREALREKIATCMDQLKKRRRRLERNRR